MKIRRVTATNLKGATFDHQLSEATAIVGSNFSGKSAVVEAIRLSLMGHIPEIGKRPNSSWELSSGAQMEVCVAFDDSTDIHRRFWLDGSTVKVELTGDDPWRFAELPLLHAESYFSMTDTERTAYVFSRIRLPDTYTADAIIAECERLSFEEAHTEQVQEAKSDVVTIVHDGFDTEHDATFQEALGIAIEQLREKFTYWNKRSKETIGAVKTLTELKLREKECSADTLADLDRQMAEKQTELDQLNGEKGKLTAKRDEAERTKGRIRQLKERLAADRIDYSAVIAKIDKQIKTEESKRILTPADVLKDGETLRRQLVGLRAEHRTKADAFVARAKQISDASDALENLDDATECPYCHSNVKGWKGKLADELRGKLTSLTHEQETARQALEELDDAITSSERAIEQFDEAVRADSAAQAEIRRLSGARESHLAASEKEEARRTEIGEELSALNIIPSEKDLAPAIAKLEESRVVVARALSQLSGRRTVAVQLGQDLKRAAQAELEHQDAAAHVLVVKAIANLLKEKREAMIEEAFADLLTIANQVTRGILKTDLCLHEGTIGMWNGGKFIPHRVFSGTEKALTYIAIAVALSSTAPMKLVILDEFGRLDEENQYKVLLRLSLLVAEEVIDQFIVVGTSLPDSQLHLEVIKVEA